jgi:hypothetical protein
MRLYIGLAEIYPNLGDLAANVTKYLANPQPLGVMQIMGDRRHLMTNSPFIPASY